ncbi:MAG: HAMP domain-containing protein [Planctomycetes bacterium]|nr:HAMP domain-containing protein [Planctomycetota bacterium]
MSLRRRIVLLHAAFALFAIVAAVSTIYAVQLQIHGATAQFESLVNDSGQVDLIRSELRTLDVHLHEVIRDRRPASDEFLNHSQTVLNHLLEVAQFSLRPSADKSVTRRLAILARNTHGPLEQVCRLANAGDFAAARNVFKDVIEINLESAGALLKQIGYEIESDRGSATEGLVTRQTQVLIMAIVIAASGVGLVLAGALIIHRRLVQPIRALQIATQAFAEGDLDHRVAVKDRDELGQLAEALNTMADALTRSQRKYRSLFENQKDVVIICDQSAVIQECHFGDTDILGVDAAGAVGQSPNEAWPAWQLAGRDWWQFIHEVVAANRPLKLSDVELPFGSGRPVVVDITAYAVDYAQTRMAAIVIRDVTERNNLQRQVRRSETIEATVNLARGIAHDFKNLLHSAASSLRMIQKTSTDELTTQRTTTALEACMQASNLARRLTRFASTDEGQPQRLNLSETVTTILGSLDEAFLENIDLKLDCDADIQTVVDKDHLTQITMNLVYNARDALPNGGRLEISTRQVEVASPQASRQKKPHALLSVSDSGCGMTDDVLKRLFEPLFSTKPRDAHGQRGMGLAVVFAIVQSSGGFIDVRTTPSIGTTISVYLPLAT